MYELFILRQTTLNGLPDKAGEAMEYHRLTACLRAFTHRQAAGYSRNVSRFYADLLSIALDKSGKL